jgi:hypothetical protein
MFIERFSDDSRAKKVREYLYEIELDKFDRNLERPRKIQPIERAYLDAIEQASNNPELGVLKLQAVIDLYGTRSDKSLPSGFCIELARRHLAQIRKEIADTAAEQLPLLEGLLDRADSIKEEEPDRANAMYRAVIELYRDHSWAASAVQRAQAALKTDDKSNTIGREAKNDDKPDGAPPKEEK